MYRNEKKCIGRILSEVRLLLLMRNALYRDEISLIHGDLQIPQQRMQTSRKLCETGLTIVRDVSSRKIHLNKNLFYFISFDSVSNTKDKINDCSDAPVPI